ncbi:MAG: DUF2723 domain-containing protein [Bacteroidia bacterium]|nr:DUF2723 domain-containing protein [Bacteroidia bacterium]
MDKVLPVLPALLSGVVYALTLAPSLMQIDSGELAAVQFTGGVAHPTGYPLFTILGWIFARLPFPGTPIFQLNVLALLFTVTGGYFFTRAMLELLNSLKLKRMVVDAKGQKTEDEAFAKSLGWVNYFAAAGSALLLAFGPTVWAQSTSVEVYSLHFALLSLVFWMLFRATDTQKPGRWLWVAAALGLSFSNHLTSVFLIPGIAVFYFTHQKFSRESFLTLGKMLAIFFPILILIYAWLPVRAAMGPELNWGNPEMGEYFWRHVKGQQFEVWLFSSSKAAGENFKAFWKGFPEELGWIGILLVIPGLIYGWQKMRRHFWSLLVFFLFNLFYAINYDIKDLEPYFLLCYLSMAVFMGMGIRFAVLKTSLPAAKMHLAAGGLAALFLIPLGLNFSAQNQSGIYTFEDYSRAALASLPENSILLSKQWDFLISETYYLQYVENYRRDVAVVDKELLRRSWYYAQLERSWPEVMNPIKPETQAFIQAVKPFEQKKRFDAGLLERKYQAVMLSLIEKNLGTHPIYMAPELVEDELQKGQISLPKNVFLIPETYFFRLSRGNAYLPAPPANQEIRFPDRSNYYLDFIRKLIPKMKANRAIYELSQGKTENARLLVADLKRGHPQYPIPPRLQGL